MVELLTHVLQGLSIVLIVLLTISSYSLLKKDERDAVFGYRINILLTLLLHITLFMPVIMQNISMYYLTFFGLQLLYLLMFPIIFKMIHSRANRLMINLVMIMMAIGLPILTRLDRQKSVKQFAFLVAASVVVLFIPMFLKKFESTRKIAAIFGVLGLIMLGLVLVLSKTTYGANLSLSVGPISIQPSEFVKLTYVLLLATLFRKRQDFKRVVFVTFIALAHTGVLVLSKDLGGALIYYAIYVVILYVATLKKRYPTLAMAVLALGGVASYSLFAHVRVRVTAWLDPWSVVERQGYQVAQSLFSIADGNWLGKGVGLGSPKSVPVVEKDFIFSAICEELGGIFAICLILLCLCLLLSMIKTSMKNSVALYKLVCVGFACAYGMQAFLTIGGAMKLIPSTGVTLPFVSYGGSSLAASMMMFGLLQGLFIKGNKVEEAKQLDRELKEAAEEVREKSEDGKEVVRKRVKVPNKKQKALLKQDDTKAAAVINSLKESKVVGAVFVIIFVSCIGYLSYFIAWGSKEDVVANNPYHLARTGNNADKVIRGSIIGSDNVVLAYTQVDENGEERRIYPYDNLFAHVVGYTTGGTYGLENAANKYLLTATRTIAESLKEDITSGKKPGDNVYTTINSTLQYVAYNALSGYSGAVVAVEAETGNILAMVSNPGFNPNNMQEIWENISEIGKSESFLVNRATQGLYPPGSTFKLLTTLAFIRENPNDYLKYAYNCNGSFSYNNISLACAHNMVHGDVNLQNALEQSCNGAFANIGTRLNNKTLMKIADDFYFDKSLGIGINIKPSSMPIDTDTKAESRTQISIGQGAVLETPIQNAMITAAIANDGILMKPKLISKVVSSTGNTVKSFGDEALGRVMQEKESKILEEMMLSVVENGTGFKAKSDHYYSAGKTGSAQYSADLEALHAWYTGYAWQEGSKKIVVSVILEGAGSGGQLAAPIAKQIYDTYFGVS